MRILLVCLCFAAAYGLSEWWASGLTEPLADGESRRLQQRRESATRFPVHYLTFTESTPVHGEAEPLSSTDGVRVFAEISSSDDSPFAHYALPFPVVLFGRRLRDLYVSPNGAVHTQPQLPCAVDHVFATRSCTLNTSYHSVIAGYLTDFNLHDCPSARVYGYHDPGHVHVRYEGVCYYGSSAANTFTVSLSRTDHRVSVRYENVSHTETLPDRMFTVAGLRPGSGDAHVHTTQRDAQRGAQQWRTTIRGAYPLYDSVVSGHTVHYCPLSLRWCAHNTTLALNDTLTHTDTNTNTPEEVPLVLYALQLSCVEKVQFYAILFLSNTSSSHYYDQSNSMNVSCNAYSNFSLWCAVNTTALRQLLSHTYTFPADALTDPHTHTHTHNTTLGVRLAWRAPQSIDATEIDPLPTDPLNITVSHTVTASHNASLSPHNTSLSYNNNNNTQQCVSQSQSTTECALSSSPCLSAQLSSAQLPCFVSNDFDSIYSQQDCANVCVEAVTETYVRDALGACCTYSTLDCAGLCSGGNRLAHNAEGAVVCCATTRAIDCAGVCGGPAVRDACGVCNGQDRNGSTCVDFSLFTVRSLHHARYLQAHTQTNTSTPTDTQTHVNANDPLYAENVFFPTFDLYLTPPGSDVSSNDTLFVDNGTNESFAISVSAVTASDSDRHPYTQAYTETETETDPQISFSLSHTLTEAPQNLSFNGSRAVTFVMGPHTHVSLSVNVSLAALLAGRTQHWRTKAVRVSYRRTAYPSFSLTQTLRVYPAVLRGCASLADVAQAQGGRESALCARVPGCVFCPTHTQMVLVDGKNSIAGYALSTPTPTPTPTPTAAPTLAPSVSRNVPQTYAERSARRLFHEFVPAAYDDEAPRASEGLCIDGFLESDCALQLSVNERIASAAEPSARRSLTETCAAMSVSVSAAVTLVVSLWLSR